MNSSILSSRELRPSKDIHAVWRELRLTRSLSTTESATGDEMAEGKAEGVVGMSRGELKSAQKKR